ncbi:MAG TPA: ankyrin repeat domain-containing protein, partial [Rhabdochlamydiaceae bacterium]
VEIMELILNHAKVLEIQLMAPDTALYTAAKNGHLNAVQFILAHANNPSIRSTSSELLGQAVIMAASVGDEPTVKFLLGLDVNIEPNGPSGLGRALCLAAEGGFTGILEQIFQHPNSRHINRHGDYSLGLAHSNAVTHLHFDAMNLISKHLP